MQAFRGTTVEQDGRWSKIDQKILDQMTKSGKFSPVLDTKVNIKKVNMDVISKWITERIIRVVGYEDEILINMIINTLQGSEVDPRRLQISITPFLNNATSSFVEELWKLFLDGQEQPNGIPRILAPAAPVSKDQTKVAETTNVKVEEGKNIEQKCEELNPLKKEYKRTRSRSPVNDEIRRKRRSESRGRRKEEYHQSRHKRSVSPNVNRRRSSPSPIVKRTRRIGSSEERDSPKRRRNSDRNSDYRRRSDSRNNGRSNDYARGGDHRERDRNREREIPIQSGEKLKDRKKSHRRSPSTSGSSTD